ncbi:MAG: hypothetical protein ACR2GH_13350 [Pseudonocardia sp.]
MRAWQDGGETSLTNCVMLLHHPPPAVAPPGMVCADP